MKILTRKSTQKLDFDAKWSPQTRFSRQIDPKSLILTNAGILCMHGCMHRVHMKHMHARKHAYYACMHIMHASILCMHAYYACMHAWMHACMHACIARSAKREEVRAPHDGLDTGVNTYIARPPWKHLRQSKAFGGPPVRNAHLFSGTST